MNSDPFAKKGPFRFYRLNSALKVNPILYPPANKTQVQSITLANIQGEMQKTDSYLAWICNS